MKAVIVHMDGTIVWTGKATRLQDHWEPGTYWGQGETKEEAFYKVAVYVPAMKDVADKLRRKRERAERSQRNTSDVYGRRQKPG